MQKLRKGLALLCIIAVSLGSLQIQARADDESEVSNNGRAVPSGYADMRVGKMEDDGFIKSDGRYAEYYYSARWAGEELSNEDTVLSPGQITYCIDPDIPLIGESGDEAYGHLGDKEVIRKLTTKLITTEGTVFCMLSRILQICGTNLTNGAELASNAQEGTKYVATQMIIWQIIWGDMDAQFNLVGSSWKKYGWEGMKYYETAPSGGKSVKEWYDLWITQLKNSQKIPSFAATSEEAAPIYEMNEDTITLADNRNTLQYMKITASEPSVKLTVSDQQLMVENPDRVDFTVTMTNTLCEGAKEPTPVLAYRVADGETRQTTILASATHLEDPVQGFFKVKAAPSTADLMIQKEVEQDDLLRSSLAGYQFRVQSTQTGYSEVHETDAEGKIVIEDLKIGAYTIEELKKGGTNINGSNFQFELPQIINLEVGADRAAVTAITVKNRLRRGSLTIHKVDAADTSIQLSGVKLLLEKKVYSLPNETKPEGSLQDEHGCYQWKTVNELVTQEGGKAVWEDLTVGEYRLTETKAASGYQLLPEPIYFSLPYGAEESWSYENAVISISQEFVLQDQPGFMMPSTGGYEAWLYIAAFALCAAGGWILWKVQIKRGKQNEA